MTSKAFAVIPAAGMGKRMGASVNKQYLLLGDRPIIAHTLQVFQDSPDITGIIVVIPADEIPYCQQTVVEAYQLSKVLAIVPGGAERQHSVHNGLAALETYAEKHDIVLIHDGVRPFITQEIIRQTILTAATGQGALVAVPVKDTIKVVHGGMVQQTPNRSTLCHAQTPQGFQFGTILTLHQRASAEQFCTTDDCALYEQYGLPVNTVNGNYRNIKITTPEDLVLAEAFLKEQAGDNIP